MALAYPTDVPFDSFGTIVSIVRNGEISTRRATFAHALWNVQGFAQKAILGDADVLEPLAAPEAETETDAVAAMERIVANQDLPTAQLAMPWQLIATWVMQQLLDLLSRRS